MEKTGAAKPSKINFLVFLPKAASTAVRFSPSPGRYKSHPNKGFSGPTTPIVFEHARNKSKDSAGFDSREPTSPKISCTGQIKQKKKMIGKKKIRKTASLPKEVVLPDNKPTTTVVSASPTEPKKKKSGGLGNIFGRAKQGRKSDASAEETIEIPDRAPPSLSQMKKFNSSRDAFSKFDWARAQVAPGEASENQRCCTSDDDEEEEDHEVIIPFSAPILRSSEIQPAPPVALEPRKEINLWKRRTMAQPKPLQLNSPV